MKANMYRLIKKNTTWKKVVFFLVLNVTIQRVLTLNFALEFKTVSNGFEAPDMKIGYGVDYFRELLANAPDVSLHYYLTHFLALDMIFPLVYSISYALLLSMIYSRAFSAQSKLQKVVILPFVGGFVDYLENISILILFLNRQEFITSLAFLASVFSMTKWILNYIGIALTFLGVVGWITNLVFTKYNKT